MYIEDLYKTASNTVRFLGSAKKEREGERGREVERGRAAEEGKGREKEGGWGKGGRGGLMERKSSREMEGEEGRVMVQILQTFSLSLSRRCSVPIVECISVVHLSKQGVQLSPPVEY